MKQLITILALEFCIASCKKDTSASASAQNSTISSNLIAGQWKITNVVKADSNVTNNFITYRLTFDKNGHVAAANDLFSVNGTWAMSASNNISVLVMNFEYIHNFELLSMDWRVTSQSGSEIKMEKTHPDNPTKDYLTIRRM